MIRNTQIKQTNLYKKKTKNPKPFNIKLPINILIQFFFYKIHFIKPLHY